MSNLINLEVLSQLEEREFSGIRNFFTTQQLNSAIVDGDNDGLMLDLSLLADSDTGLITLLDGTEVDPANIYGTVFVGPYPFESELSNWDEKRFRRGRSIEAGKGEINTTYLITSDHNSEGALDSGITAVHITLYEKDADSDRDRPLGDNVGSYDTYVSFRLEDTNNSGKLGDDGDTTRKLASFILPPAVNLVRSEDTGNIVISFETDEAVSAVVKVEGLGDFTSSTATRHAVEITGLEPDSSYSYTVTIGEDDNAVTFPENTFTTAPEKGDLPEDGSIRTVFLSDSREGIPEEGLEAFMGVNADTLGRALNLGWQLGGELMIFGGDLINGYTTSPEDYANQFDAFQQTVAPFQSQHPVYPAMGNHESLLREYRDPETGARVRIDRFDDSGSYETESSEAVFADSFINPTNGPETSEPERPSYEENVYSFQYGPTLYLAINNNYWVSYASSLVGGSPEGYMFQDQLNWIDEQLDNAENDESIKYIILYFQEPPFPNGGHANDSMWYAAPELPTDPPYDNGIVEEGDNIVRSFKGDNNVRAYAYDQESGELIPEEKGILEVRDQFARIVADSSKVAAVMAGDEHSYHRVLIDENVPVGNIELDDPDGNGIVGDDTGELEPELSPLSDLANPVWYITSGTAGAPYYSEEITPWQKYWNEQEDPEVGFKYSSQEGVVIFDADDEGIAMEFYNLNGELVDRIDDLMAVKEGDFSGIGGIEVGDSEDFDLPEIAFTYSTEEPPAPEPGDGTFIVDVEGMEAAGSEIVSGIRNFITIEQLNAAIGDGDEDGLTLDFSRLADPNTGLITLLDGSTVDPANIYGTVFVGPYPFEAELSDWNEVRHRRGRSIEGGKGLINTTYLVTSDHNSEGALDTGIVAVRATIYEERPGEDRILGDNVSTYDTYTAFRLEDTNNSGKLGDEGDTTRKLPSFIELPAVSMIRSDDPTSMVISFEAAAPVNATVEIENVGSFISDAPATRHVIPVNGLQADTEYTYRVILGEEDNAIAMSANSFTTAPEAGELPSNGVVKTIFLSDSREGVPEEGLEAFMGVNADTLGRTLNKGWLEDGDLMIFGGDLINGYTTSPEDFRTMLNAYKQTVAPFRAEHPVYPAMGNHESLLTTYDDGSSFGIQVDKFDEGGGYDIDSAEAVFADEFINPTNGPETSDPYRPTYKENVYSYQYGPTKYLAINNNYWVSYNSDQYGGTPEGYMFQDQLEWIEQELEMAENDDTVKYIILYFQEPPFPNGGHANDSMWYANPELPTDPPYDNGIVEEGDNIVRSFKGDNNVRAYRYDQESEELVPEEKGILEVRDQFAHIVASSSKVAAVMAGDEHSYHRVLIDENVPVGNIKVDDPDGNGIVGDHTGELEPELSPLSTLENGVWYITAGTAGAPYYSEEITPWQKYWNEQENPEEGFKYSSQEGTVVFEATEDGISMEFINLNGEVVDRIENLMDVKSEEVTPPPKLVTGTNGDDEFDSAFPDEKMFVGDSQILSTGGGDDYVDVSQVGENNRIDTGSGDDIVFVGTNNRVILGAGDDIIFAGSGQGGNRISLGAGNDQLWLTEDDNSIPRNPNRVSDFNPDDDVIGFANTVLSLGNKGDLWDYEQVGNDVIISAFGPEIAQLLNTNITDADFVFA